MKTTLEIISEAFAKRKACKTNRLRTSDEPLKIKPFYCNDKMSLSVQASMKHNCFPKNNEGPYASVEVGFPTSPPPESWREYCAGDFDKKPCDTVYRNVPVGLVAAFIDMHGGVRAEEAPKLVLPAPSKPVQRTFIEQKRYNITFQDMGMAV